MRLRKDKTANEVVLENPNLVIKNFEEKINNWKKIYKREKIYLEIGMGKGKFIIEHALKNKDILFVGLEKEATVLVKALKKAKSLGIDNLVFLNEDAANIKTFFGNKEIDKIYLNFSDPWPKKRHTKRRLTSETFLMDYKFILNEDADIELKTDNSKLFAYTVVTLNNYNMEFLDLSVDLHSEREDVITTEYEDKFLKNNKPIYFLKVKFRNGE
ncbi:MAG: tRNA (guanosine(46)-N7)-methyltransferase TrmB [Bacilli bacterium]|nr:tRNA (guanosine(46)-N7)-methyltransferase TrmB [Bacilli bacterium]